MQHRKNAMQHRQYVMQNRSNVMQHREYAMQHVMAQMLSGYFPFLSHSQPTLFRKIQSGEYSFPDEFWGDVSPSAKDLICKVFFLYSKKNVFCFQISNLVILVNDLHAVCMQFTSGCGLLDPNDQRE